MSVRLGDFLATLEDLPPDTMVSFMVFEPAAGRHVDLHPEAIERYKVSDTKMSIVVALKKMAP